jgi:hypothetical protein
VQKLDKYELRYLINEEAQLIHYGGRYSLNRLDESLMNKAVSGVGNLLKSAGLAIPGFDLIVGSFLALIDVAGLKSAAEKIVAGIDGSDNILDHLGADDMTWQSSLQQIQALSKQERDLLKNEFDNFLRKLKNLVLTIIQSYDSALAAAPAAAAGAATAVAGGAGAVAVEGGTNLLTSVASFIASIMEPEQFLFAAGTKIAGFLDKIFDYLGGESDSGLNKLAQKGGSVVMALITNPLESFSRLGQLYDALHEEGVTALTDVGGAVKNLGIDYAKKQVGLGDLDLSSFSAGPDLPMDLPMAAESRNRRLTDQSPVLNESRMLKLAGIK